MAVTFDREGGNAVVEELSKLFGFDLSGKVTGLDIDTFPVSDGKMRSIVTIEVVKVTDPEAIADLFAAMRAAR